MNVRNDIRPGDLGEIVRLHGVIYAREYGFDETFEAYVAGPMAEFVLRRAERERIWIAEQDDRIVGCIAIVSASPTEAQLRWFLVDPVARDQGIGRRLLREAVDFCRKCTYESVFLWTVDMLKPAGRLYREHGFKRVEQRAGRCWGIELVEERYLLNLGEDSAVTTSR
jgi:GNAT superfamily N-acetyltransferase